MALELNEVEPSQITVPAPGLAGGVEQLTPKASFFGKVKIKQVLNIIVLPRLS